MRVPSDTGVVRCKAERARASEEMFAIEAEGRGMRAREMLRYVAAFMQKARDAILEDWRRTPPFSIGAEIGAVVLKRSPTTAPEDETMVSVAARQAKAVAHADASRSARLGSYGPGQPMSLPPRRLSRAGAFLLHANPKLACNPNDENNFTKFTEQNPG